jgi:hypothetical protein
MGLSEDRVRQRSSREGWMSAPGARENAKAALAARTTEKSVTTLSPAALVHAELHSLGQRSRVSLARTIVKASEHLETLEPERIVEQASDVKAIAQTADLVHGWKDASPQVKIRLDVLGATAEAQITEIEADVSSSDVWDNVSTDVEDY